MAHNTFENAIPTLLGADTHAAVVSIETGIENDQISNAVDFSEDPKQTTVSANSKLTTLSNINVQTGEKVLLTAFFASGYGAGATTLNYERNSVDQALILTVPFPGVNDASFVVGQVLDDPGAGNFVYRLNANLAAEYQGVILIATVLKPELTGANTQHTVPPKRVFS